MGGGGGVMPIYLRPNQATDAHSALLEKNTAWMPTPRTDRQQEKSLGYLPLYCKSSYLNNSLKHVKKTFCFFFSNSAFHYKAPPTHHSIMGIKDITVNGPWTAYLLRLE